MRKENFDKYIKRFPKSTQQALSHEHNLRDFLNKVQADYKPVKVYRAVKNENHIDDNDFISLVEERKMTSDKIEKRIEKDKNFKIDFFGVSVNENINEMIIALKFPSERHKGIVSGMMKKENGPADFEKGSTHHNWYIFQDRMQNVLQSFSKYIISNENKK